MELGNMESRIGELSRAFTPEWRFSSSQPDLGSSLALQFAAFMEESCRMYGMLPKVHRIRFFDRLGARCRPAVPAEGFLCFDLAKPDLPSATVPRGIRVEGKSQVGEKLLFEVLDTVAVSPSKVDREPYPAEDGAWYLRFSLPLTEPLHSLLVTVVPGEDRGERMYLWEYGTGGGFQKLTVEDGSRMLERTGLVRFVVTEEMDRQEHFGLTGYWIRIREADGKPIPCTARFYLNGAPVQALSGGSGGNLPPFCHFQLTKTVGFVSEIQNPDVLYGGAESEEAEEARIRLAAGIKHQSLAVTPQDMEALVREASLNVEKVTCYSGIGRDGKPAPGHVTLAVLQRDYESGRKYFCHLEEMLFRVLRERVSPALTVGGRLSFTAPWFVRYHVEAVLAVREYHQIIPLQRQAEEALKAYLDPVTGGYGGQGWDFGDLPGYGQVKHMLQRQEGISYVQKMSLTVFLEADGMTRERELGDLKQLPWVLPSWGSHRISVVVGGL